MLGGSDHNAPSEVISPLAEFFSTRRSRLAWRE